MADMSQPIKNTAFTLSFTLYKNDGTIVANPGTYTKKVSVDGAAVADIAAAVTEEDTTYGQLSLVLATGEMNGDFIWVYVTDNTAGTVPFTCSLYPAAGAPASAAALATVDSNVDDILIDTSTTLDTLIKDVPTNAELTTALGTADDTTLAAIAAVSTKVGTPQQTDLSTELHNVHAHSAEWVDGGRLDLLLDTAAAGGGSSGGGGGGLDAAEIRTAVGLTTANLDTQFDALADVVAGISGGGGFIEWPYTLVEPDTTPIADAEVWITTDAEGNDIVASGRTNNFGALRPVPKLDAGTYYFWSQKSGYNFDSPAEEVVS